MPEETSLSWLERVKRGRDHAAWTEMQQIYAPFVHRILAAQGLPHTDCDDVVQNVMSVLIRRLPSFERRRNGSFRKWLRCITSNVLREFWRSREHTARGIGGDEAYDMLIAFEDPSSPLSRLWDEQHDQHVLRSILKKVRGDFSESTWRAFELTAVDNESAGDVARILGITENSVYIARSRVMKRIKDITGELLD